MIGETVSPWTDPIKVAVKKEKNCISSWLFPFRISCYRFTTQLAIKWQGKIRNNKIKAGYTATTARLSECPEKPKLYLAWQKYFSFAKMLSNELPSDSQINQGPFLGWLWERQNLSGRKIDSNDNTIQTSISSWFLIDLEVAQWLIWKHFWKHFCEYKIFLPGDVQFWLF